MEQIVTLTMFSVVLFILIKIIEMKFISKTMKPIKEVVRDALLVGMAVGLSAFSVFTLQGNKAVSELINGLSEKQVLTGQAPVFTDNPGF
jgi:hypothetical protein